MTCDSIQSEYAAATQQNFWGASLEEILNPMVRATVVPYEIFATFEYLFSSRDRGVVEVSSTNVQYLEFGTRFLLLSYILSISHFEKFGNPLSF